MRSIERRAQRRAARRHERELARLAADLLRRTAPELPAIIPSVLPPMPPIGRKLAGTRTKLSSARVEALKRRLRAYWLSFGGMTDEEERAILANELPKDGDNE